MPKLSDTMVEGVIVAWHKKIGDTVESGELLAEIETDKATMELESFYDGTLLYLEVEEDGSVVVGKLLAIIGDSDEDVDAIVKEYQANQKPAVAAPVAAPAAVSTPAAAPAAVASDDDSRVKASPLAKAMAKERGIDLRTVTGTGPEGRVVKRDIEEYKPSAAAPAAMSAPLPVGEERFTEEPLSQMRKTIARRLGESKFSAPHFYLTMEIDMSKAVESRKGINEVAPSKISFNDMIIKATAMALRKNPKANSAWMGDRIRYNEHVHIGMAVAVDEGLMVPVIRFADSLSFSQISGEARRLAGLARDRKLQPADMTGNTFTISNLGMFGISEFTAIINSPDACILAVGAIRDVPVVKDGQIVPGKTMKVTLSCDHRVVDGAVGSAFLKTFKELLEDPVRMLI
ncbi:UNVERIFIED_CONTAM: hypothetical protein GTU68_014989 [Idotea baltica]|nr:hypothetical protein [Idotea baltica]